MNNAEYIALGILCIAVILCLVISSRKDVVRHNSHASNVDGLVRAAKQWLDASLRDTNNVAAVLHVSYGTAYLHAARSMMNDEDILMATGIDVKTLMTNFERQQKLAVERLQPTPTRVTPFRPGGQLNSSTRPLPNRK